MNAVIAIDSFKGSLSSLESGKAVSEAIKSVYPDAGISVFPIADGGEGTSDAIIRAKGARKVNISVHGPLGDIIESSYGIIEGEGKAIIEMASAAGITLIDKSRLDPLLTTTYGVGEMISDAIGRGCRDFIIGIGGSATNDGGTGMLSALGFEFLDSYGNKVPCSGSGLGLIKEIKCDKVIPALSDCRFTVACDVKNPLCGENGCSAVYGPQKGATPETVEKMDKWLKNYAKLTKELFPNADGDFPGSGAAGGLGFALRTYLKAELRSGIDTVIEAIGLENAVKNADIVITGEGRLDSQTAQGKAPIGIARVAKKYGKTVIAFSGAVNDRASECNMHGIDAFFPIVRRPCTLSEAIDKENAYKNLKDTAEQVFRLIKSTSNGF